MITLIDDYDSNKKAIINPEDIFKKENKFPKHMVGCFTKSILDYFGEKEEVEIIGHNASANGASPIYKTTYNGEEIGMCMFYVGASPSAALIEELIARGVEKFVVFGSCGVLDRSLDDGTLIIPKEAIRDEGTSFHYLAPSLSVAMDNQSIDILGKTMNAMNIPHVIGNTWTTDAFYRETKSRMEKRIKQGCMCVEMECSALLAVTKFREVKYAQFLFAADNLDEEIWQQRGLHINQGLTACDVYMDIAMKSVLEL